MKKLKRCCRVAVLMTGLLLTPQLATFADAPTAQENNNNLTAQNNEANVNAAIDEKAADILRQMSDLIESQEKFSFYAESERDILTLNGVYIQVHHEGSTIVNRPNQFRANVTGELVQRELLYDGSKVTIVDTERNIYARGDVTDNMDETLDTLIQKLNIDMPLAELLYSDIYEGLTKNVQAGFLLRHV